MLNTNRRTGEREKRRTGEKVFLAPIPRFPVSPFLRFLFRGSPILRFVFLQTGTMELGV